VGHVVLVTGEAGIGKSRLVQTLKEHVSTEAHTWLECSGSPYHQNTPFFAVTEMLPQVLAWHGDEDLSERLTAGDHAQRHPQRQIALEHVEPLGLGTDDAGTGNACHCDFLPQITGRSGQHPPDRRTVRARCVAP